MVVAGDVREGRFGQAESSMVIKKEPHGAYNPASIGWRG